MGLDDVAQKAIELYGVAGILIALLIGLLIRAERRCDRLEDENKNLRDQIIETNDKRIEETRALIISVERFTVAIDAMQKVVDQVGAALVTVKGGRR